MVRPYEKAELNLLNIFNEFVGLMVSYVILPLQDNYYDPDSHAEIGKVAIYIFYLCGATNVTIIFGLAAYDIYR